MQKFYKLCYPLILGIVIAALVIGVATRISYRNISEDEAIYTIQENWEYNKEADEMQYKGLVVDNLVKDIDEKKILKEKSDGKTILIASHSKEEIQELCDEIIFMEDGKIKDIVKVER